LGQNGFVGLSPLANAGIAQHVEENIVRMNDRPSPDTRLMARAQIYPGEVDALPGNS